MNAAVVDKDHEAEEDFTVTHYSQDALLEDVKFAFETQMREKAPEPAHNLDEFILYKMQERMIKSLDVRSDGPINFYQRIYEAAMYALLCYCETLPLEVSQHKSFAIEPDFGCILADALKVDKRL